ncbi:arylsulfatase [Jiulongibacter sediminis]|uniref:Sulfatase N-terminal domain-containing protein n=1 Tax=Jiulongibacter sediminis TaxID=1605367 RepID=A0A0P7BSU5_9BACT|nr:arylsulfatase [Jiulongibacter sediminis]KPM47542.1 hypothetical protein AFM12_13635 [Jiulongibacter sediminis]TBX23336.1 hypothetical protein TK44_13645 [Jiulongibacter sediminis]
MKFKTLLGLCLSIFTLGCSQPEKPAKPNIIYIMADDLGYGDVGIYGQKDIPTPNIDRLAAEGMLFTRHYAGNTVCAPSRCTLMTGKHNGHARIRGNLRVPLEPEDQTVAELLKSEGYTTALIGKWGLGEEGSTGVPNKQGFDYFYGYLNQVHAHNHYPAFLYENEGKDSLGNVVEEVKTGYQGGNGGISTNKKVYSNDKFEEKSLAFLEENKDKPFFLYLPLIVPHANNEARRFDQSGMEVPSFAAFDDRDWPEDQKRHAAMITELDNTVGAVMAKIKELGIDDNTLIIFTSDNGPHAEGGSDPDFFNSNGPLRGIKRDLYEGGIRVPTIARWPGKIKAGSASDHVSGFVDFFETMADLVHSQQTSETDGISYLPTLLGENQPKHEFMYWEFHEQGGKQGIIMDQYKCIRLNVNKPEETNVELYDLSTDIKEQNNIASENPEIVKKALAIIDREHTYSEEFHFNHEENSTHKNE